MDSAVRHHDSHPYISTARTPPEFGNSLTDYQMTEALKISAGVFDVRVRCALYDYPFV
jgi:hypothetical protein